jgi:broad specificity phosphatase PhoE
VGLLRRRELVTDEQEPRGSSGNGGSTRIFLVRHGETEWNRTKRAQGLADVDLNEQGRRQAEATAARLASEPVDAVYASDLARARDTAVPIAERHGLSVVEDPDFREIDQGEWTGLSADEIWSRWPDLRGARHHSRRPGGESPAQVRARNLAALQRVVESHPGGTVVVVGHGGALRWVAAEALGFDNLRAGRIRGLANGAVVEVKGRIEGGALLLGDLRRLDGATVDLDDPNA